MKRGTFPARLAGLGGLWAAALTFAVGASAQVTPAAGTTPPDDKPFVKIGGTLFMDYTYTDSPKGKDANGNEINPNSFNITRGYINVTGQLHHLVSFRITPDIVRDTDATGSLAGSLVVRLKYGFGQFNMDEWTTKGTWIRLGLQQTPYIDYAEGIYRYRFQGPTEVDRDGFLTSSDLGLSGHYNFPGNFGDVHLGFYNGEGYNKAEANDQKGFQVRASVRPLPSVQVAKGWRISGFYNADHVAHDQKRNRWLVDTTFEYQYMNAGFSYIWGENQAAPGAPTVTATGLSAWVNPRTSFGLEALVRYDEYKANRDLDPKKKRVIAGIAWWFDFGHGINAALMADYDDETFSDYSPAVPDNRKYGLHTLLNF
ncbi:MAG: hypothetical protein ACM3JH_01010 [Acidithiobacillales bacterium]